MINTETWQFPHPEESDNQGLLAIGGNLSSDTLLQAYRMGIFPWYEKGSPILWWSPNPRLLLIPDELRVSKNLKKSLQKPWQFSIDTAFTEVIEACATTGSRTGETWIIEEMKEAYIHLHTQGYAHSFEIRLDNELVGGLYGISLGRAFFGESMFHTVTDASRVALWYLCAFMKQYHFSFIDCQLPTAHLQKLGATAISRKAFLHKLAQALEYPDLIGKWHFPMEHDNINSI